MPQIFKLLKALIGFLFSAILDEEEWDYRHPDFNPGKVVIMIVLVLVLSITTISSYKFSLFYLWVEDHYPNILIEYKEKK